MAPEPRSHSAIIAQRTAALAARPGPGSAARPGAPAAAPRALILWTAGGSLGAVGLAEVEAVLPFRGCARLPTREPACLGVLGHAGRFYSVMDLPRLLGISADSDSDTDPGTDAGAERAHLLLLRGAAPALALAVDRVLGRFDLPDRGDTTEYEGRLVSILDLAPWRQRFAARP